MKKSYLFFALIIAAMVLVFDSCKKDEDSNTPPPSDQPFENLVVADNFIWVTSKNLRIDLLITDGQNNPVQTDLDIYDSYPGGTLLLHGSTSQNGVFLKKYKVASSKNKIVVVIPNNEPVEVAFTDVIINNYDAFEAKNTIVLANKGFKSVRAEVYTYYPAEDKYGTICFEDMWPKSGDYDFNDAVLDYNVVAVGDDENPGFVNRIEMTIYLRAKGASYQNGFGISFMQHWSFQGPYPNISSVTVNGVNIPDENASYPSFLLIPNLSDELPYFNTRSSQGFTNPVKFDVVINFAEPISEWEMELPLQNPFLIVNQERGKEIHRPYDLPTSLANPIYAQTEDDFTDPEAFNPENFKMMIGYTTYVTEYAFPWVIDIYDGSMEELFAYPAENEDLSETYTSFPCWVTEWDPMDWYLSGYADTEKTYPFMPPAYPVKK